MGEKCGSLFTYNTLQSKIGGWIYRGRERKSGRDREQKQHKQQKAYCATWYYYTILRQYFKVIFSQSSVTQCYRFCRWSSFFSVIFSTCNSLCYVWIAFSKIHGPSCGIQRRFSHYKVFPLSLSLLLPTIVEVFVILLMLSHVDEI